MEAPAAAFLAWCAAAQIEWHDQLLLRRAGKEEYEWHADEGGWVVALQARVRRGAVLARIPTTALLCARRSALARQPRFQTALHEHKASFCLALCVLYELRLGAASAFAAYLDMCSPAPLPMLWPQAWPGASWFHGTEAWRMLERRACLWTRMPQRPGVCRVRKEAHGRRSYVRSRAT